MNHKAKLFTIGECNYKLHSILELLCDLSDGKDDFDEYLVEAAYHIKTAYEILHELVDESALSILGGEIDG